MDIQAAWRGDEPPTDEQRVPYLMLRALYQDFRTGAVDQGTGECIKGYLLRYDSLTPSERITLLTFTIVNLCKRAGDGDAAALADSVELARECSRLKSAE